MSVQPLVPTVQVKHKQRALMTPLYLRARGGGGGELMKPNEPPWDTPPLDLSPELKKAVQNALKQTNALCPPPRYDASYWREERIAIAQMAVWQAAQAYRDETGVPLEKFACLCAKRAIYAEWLALCQRDNAEEPFPVDEETGEELEFADVEA